MKIALGVNLSTSAAPGADPVSDARRAEELGYDHLSASDHPQGAHPTFETWTLLAWVAARTNGIGILPNVLGLPYRPPAIVAKMAETLDRLSHGRLTLGLGAGGNDAAMRALGLAVRSPGDKVQALAEAIDIVRGMWTEESFTYHGSQFRTESARIEPRPSRPIPIWLGVYGPKGLALAGKKADGWSPSLPYAPLEQATEMRKRVLDAARAAGRPAGAVVCNYNFGVLVGGRATDDRVVAGSAEEVAGRMVSFVEAGFTSLTFWPVGDERRQVEVLARDVVPRVRDAAGALP